MQFFYAQIESLREYIKSAVVIFNKLEKENKDVRALIVKKDKDIQRVLESVVISEAENETDFKLQLNLYKEELDLINKHMNELTNKLQET